MKSPPTTLKGTVLSTSSWMILNFLLKAWCLEAWRTQALTKRVIDEKNGYIFPLFSVTYKLEYEPECLQTNILKGLNILHQCDTFNMSASFCSRVCLLLQNMPTLLLQNSRWIYVYYSGWLCSQYRIFTLPSHILPAGNMGDWAECFLLWHSVREPGGSEVPQSQQSDLMCSDIMLCSASESLV